MLEPVVLLLQCHQTLQLVDLHPANLPPPAVEDLLRHANLPAGFACRLAPPTQDLHLPQMRDDLRRAEPPLRHLIRPVSRRILTLGLDQFWGVRSAGQIQSPARWLQGHVALVAQPRGRTCASALGSEESIHQFLQGGSDREGVLTSLLVLQVGEDLRGLHLRPVFPWAENPS